MRPIKDIKAALWNKETDPVFPKLYQPIEHPEFKEWGCHQPCVERWGMIRKELGMGDGYTFDSGSGAAPPRVLDLGCHTGWFCRKFSSVGWRAIGIDDSDVAIEVASEFMKDYAIGPPPVYTLADVRDCAIPRADVALCLSTIMYLLPTLKDRDGWQVLDWVSRSAPVMFADWGGVYGGHLPGKPQDMADLILTHTHYTTAKQLGVTDFESRPFYVFHREPNWYRSKPCVRWVLGGTAVGKKHWMKEREWSGACKSVWMEDGNFSTEQLLRDELDLNKDLYVRWQWGRERVIMDVAKNHPDVSQSLLLLSCSPEEQYRRANEREGTAPWSIEALVGEASEVRHLAKQVADRCHLPLEEIDVTQRYE